MIALILLTSFFLNPHNIITFLLHFAPYCIAALLLEIIVLKACLPPISLLKITKVSIINAGATIAIASLCLIVGDVLQTLIEFSLGGILYLFHDFLEISGTTAKILDMVMSLFVLFITFLTCGAAKEEINNKFFEGSPAHTIRKATWLAHIASSLILSMAIYTFLLRTNEIIIVEK